MSTSAKGRLPSRPLSYKHKELCTKEELMVDYITGRIYVRLTTGDIVDVTSIVLQDIRNFKTMDDYISIHMPNSTSTITIKAAYADIIARINAANQAIEDLQNEDIVNSLHDIIKKSYIAADTELYNTLTNDYKNADTVLKEYVNELFRNLGLVYNETTNTYTINIDNAYVIHDGVSEVYNISVKLAPPSEENGITMQNSTSFYVYTIPVTEEQGYIISLNPNTDKIVSKELNLITTKGSTLNFIMNQIENKKDQIPEYQSIVYTIIGNGAIFVFSDYPITTEMNITFTISRN